MTNLPPHDSIREFVVHDQLRPDVRTQLLDLESSSYHLPSWAQATAEDMMIEHLDNADTRQSLVDEVRALRHRAAKVDEAFERVRKGLRRLEVDAKIHKDKEHDGKPIPKFESTWAGYQKRWTNLLWGSGDIATKTQAYIRDFLEVIIPEVECIETKNDLADANLDLEVFIKQEDPKQHNSQETVNVTQNYSQDFTDLKCDLEIFQNTFNEVFAEDHKASLGVAITMKQAEIKNLDEEIKMCETVVMAMGIALAATVRVAHDGTVGAQASLGPISATGVGIVGAIAAISELKYLVEYAAKTDGERTEQAKAQRSLGKLQIQLNNLQALQASLDNQKADVPYIGDRLDRFSAIRELVRHDAEVIQSVLNSVISDQGSRKALNKRIGLMKASYTRLCEALNLYTLTNSSKINNPT